MCRRIDSIAITGLVAGVAFAAGCGAWPTDSAVPNSSSLRLEPANAAVATSDTIPNEYLVQLRPNGADVSTEARLAVRDGGQLLAIWRHALTGYAVRTTPAAVAAIRARAAVWRVTPNRVVTLAYGQYPVASWGLDRIDQRDSVLDQRYLFPELGAGVRIYIIDSGIRETHVDFGERASWGVDLVDGSKTDCMGHGTAVAGVAGGFRFGVAKGAQLVAVRVLGCSSATSTAQVLSGVDWVTANGARPAVVNMSLKLNGTDDILDFAILRSIAAGFIYVVAAANDNADACSISPARVTAAITVGASGGPSAPASGVDQRATYSNWGPCVDLFAPGTNIPSAFNTSDVGTVRASGTSFSAPFTAGVVAQLLEHAPALNPVQVATTLDAWALKGVLSGIDPSTPNKLLQSWFQGVVTGNQPPLADFHTTCNAVTHRCALDGRWSIDDEPVSLLTFGWTATGRRTLDTPVITRFGGLEMSPDSYRETLRVTDRQGLAGSTTRTVRIP